MSARKSLALLKVEMEKVWSRPILEITIALMIIMAIMYTGPLTGIFPLLEFDAALNSALIGSVSSTANSLMFPCVIMCAVLMTLSFARDYEQGMMQSILSVPVSRGVYFVVKFFAVVLPLVLLSWGVTAFLVGLTFYSSPWLVLQSSFFVLPFSFLTLMFCGGISVLIALIIKRTIPSVLTAMLANFFLWFLTNLDTYQLLEEGVSYANFLCLTPYKGALLFLDRSLGISSRYANRFPDALEFSLSGEWFGILMVFYAFVLVVPLFVYFSRRFEICE
ncbi:MAG: ABC transporter permease subunit [Crenarchaeota archaeon]|nr:ABC transporter permease subunit [Thermoproteota archaeon]